MLQDQPKRHPVWFRVSDFAAAAGGYTMRRLERHGRSDFLYFVKHKDRTRNQCRLSPGMFSSLDKAPLKASFEFLSGRFCRPAAASPSHSLSNGDRLHRAVRTIFRGAARCVHCCGRVTLPAAAAPESPPCPMNYSRTVAGAPDSRSAQPYASKCGTGDAERYKPLNLSGRLFSVYGDRAHL